MQICSKLKDDLLAFLGEKVRVREFHDTCVVTLPLETVDKRKISVVVESIGDTFVVHDGGKTLSELFCHGVPITEARLSHQNNIAARHGVHFKNKMIRAVCKRDDLEKAIFAVAQCSSMALHDLVDHKPKFEDDSVPYKVLHLLDLWRPDGVNIAKNVEFKTVESDHRLNAVCYAPKAIVGVKVLGYDNPKKNAQQYAYMDIDMARNEAYKHWLRFVIISGAENWSQRSLGLVRRHSTRALEVPSRSENEFLGLIPSIMDEMITQPASLFQ